MLQDLLNFVYKFLLKNEKIISVRVKKSWFEKHDFLNFYNEIIKYTNFLCENVSFGERIYCLINNIKEPCLCKYCKELRHFNFFKAGYHNTCSKSQCVKSYMNEKIQSTEQDLTRNQLRSLKAAITMKQTDKSGLTIYKKAAKKAYITKRQNKDDNGLDVYQRAALKGFQTTSIKDEYGLTIRNKGAQKAAKTKRQRMIGNLNIIQLQTLKAIKTKLTRIDKNGLNGFQRAFLTGNKYNIYKQYEQSNLYFQGSYERKFLDLISRIGYLDKTYNCRHRFYYFNYGKRKIYHPDYLLNENVFEIKSRWTYDKLGKDIELRKINNLKWQSVIKSKFSFFVVWNNEFLMNLNLEDIKNKNIEEALYLEEKFVPLTSENFLQIL